MFSFTIKTCLKSCNWCANKGCVDEFASCPQWAKGGYCSSHSFFMTHSCRESCGTCGFLSSLSKEKQVYNKQSYSRISDPDFDCGRYKSFDDLESIGVEVARGREGTDFNETEEAKSAKAERVEEHLSECRNISMEDDPEKVSFGNVNSDSKIFCSASIIADRWMITAAHCQDEVKSPGRIVSQILRTSFPQFKEYVEVKRTFIHPGYKTGELNSDIALVELGRRVEFNLDEFGDTPTCLDQGLDLPGRVATAQGFGKTELDNGGNLLEINVTLIDTSECIDQLETFFKTKPKTKKKFCDTFPLGISDDHICARGIKKVNWCQISLNI
ncbi:trypsin 3A1 [Eurytemora carolleeae]|uniref:trypsin 3A1 n=1 Tax=Eurytemora carolleeae TaxID=1294199 RepID=UPI000C782A92|nr:trypsin 3A1 [Eurytemora carolleeae]|eukprot:XP_023326935.1 trypsin 3A1-like [Eurytemora affinis]